MNTYTLLIAVLAPVLMALLADLMGYERARREYREAAIAHRKDPILNPLEPVEPDFDWPLMWVRLAIGLLTGAASALGISSTAGM